MDRVPLGISKVDKMISGGVLPGFNLLFTGLPGSGKSLFVHKMVYSLLERGYYVVFMATDRSAAQLIMEVKNLGMNYSKYFKNGKLILIDVYSGKAVLEKSTLSADVRDLTSVSLLIDKVMDRLKGKKVVQVYDVLSELFVWTRRDDLIIQFVSSACARTSATNSIALFVVNEGMQKQEYLNSIKAITQGTIKLGFDDERRWFKIEKMKSTITDRSKVYFRINRKDGRISFLRK